MTHTGPSSFMSHGPYERKYVSQRKYQLNAASSRGAGIENIDSDLYTSRSAFFFVFEHSEAVESLTSNRSYSYVKV